MAEQQMTPEQVEELKEKLKNMSPEELKEFQKKQCIFCHIISGKVQSKKIFEDSQALAILDINPANPGHILLMPKEHYSIMPQLPENDLKHIFMVSKALSNVLLKTVDASGTNIIVANGPAAGQKAQHFMVHIIPRQDEDNLAFSLPKREVDETTLNKITPMIQKKMEELSGKKIVEQIEEVPKVIKNLDIMKEGKKVISNIKVPNEKNVIEAEFEDSVKEQKNKVPAKKKTVMKETIDLDEIARVLGVK